MADRLASRPMANSVVLRCIRGLLSVVAVQALPSMLGTDAAAGVFSDVPDGHYARREIEAIYHKQISLGCRSTPSDAPAAFCPLEAVTRADMAAFVGRAYRGPGWVPPAGSSMFGDVDESSALKDWIVQTHGDGLMEPCSPPAGAPPDSLWFCPNALVTKAEFAAILLRAKWGAAYVPPPPGPVLFEDVSPRDTTAPWVHEARREGIVAGCGWGRYCPGAPVSHEEMAIFLTRTFSLLQTRLNLAAIAITASATYSSNSVGNLIDDDVETAWISGAAAPQWLIIDTGAVRPLAKVELLVTQNPAGTTTHKVFVSVDGVNWDANPGMPGVDAATTTTSSTQDSQGVTLPVREFARYIKIETTQGPSWVGWRELRVFEEVIGPERVRSIKQPEDIRSFSTRFLHARHGGPYCRSTWNAFYLCARYQTRGANSPVARPTSYDAAPNTGLGPLTPAFQRGPDGGSAPQSTFQLSGHGVGIFMRSWDSDFPDHANGINKHTVYEHVWRSPPYMFVNTTDPDDFTGGFVLQADISVHQFEQWRISTGGAPVGAVAGQLAFGAYFEDPSGNTMHFVIFVYDSRQGWGMREDVPGELGLQASCDKYASTTVKKGRHMAYSTILADSGGDLSNTPWPGEHRFFRVYITPRNLRKAIKARNALCPNAPELDPNPLTYKVRQVFLNQEVFYNDDRDAWVMGSSFRHFGVFELNH